MTDSVADDALDPEVLAIGTVHKVLKGLDAAAQERVITYVVKKLNLELHGPAANPVRTQSEANQTESPAAPILSLDLSACLHELVEGECISQHHFVSQHRGIVGGEGLLRFTRWYDPQSPVGGRSVVDDCAIDILFDEEEGFVRNHSSGNAAILDDSREILAARNGG